MKNHLNLIALQLRARTEYRVDFIIEVFAVLLSTFVPLGLIQYVIGTRGDIVGWSASETAWLIAIMMIARGIVDVVFDGVWSIRPLVHSGDFDTILVRPTSILSQVASREVSLDGLSSLSVGFGLVAYATAIDGLLSHISCLIIAYSLICLVLVLICIDLVSNAIAFWDRSAHSALPFAMASLVDLAKYPLGLFDAPIRLLLSTIIPVALVIYYPVSAALGKFPANVEVFVIQTLTVFGMIFFSCRFWRISLTRYENSGG